MADDRAPAGETAPPDEPDTLPVAPASRADALPRGTQLGRYMLLERIGRGGMGTVYAAQDPQLDRRLAIKILRTPAHDPTARTELLREGQALAMLSHPNVVPVYDVGVADGRVWLAMAEVTGGALTRWLATARSWREIVTMFAAAGRGLAAAHDAGLVHGDFKPPNVLIDARGEPCVVDFGLARRTASATRSSRVVPDAVPRHDESTRDGVVRGTPAYMAPEQMCGLPLDARTDQFAFCVALFVALFGRHPFLDEDGSDAPVAVRPLLERIEAGRVAPRPEAVGVPRSVERAMLRGLASRPERRWPSMHPLVERLERSLRARGPWLPPLAVVGAATVAWSLWPPPQPPACDGAAELAEVWNPDRAAAVSSRLRSFETASALDTATRVGEGLEAWAERWRVRHAELCASPRTDARACLDAARTGFATTLDVLERADRSTLRRAATAVRRLPAPEACGDGPGTVAGRGAAAQAVDRQLAEIEALEAAGRLDAALAAAQAAIVAADAVGEPVVAARAHRTLGSVFEALGRYADAEVELDRARWMAVENGRDDLAVAAITSLIKIVGHDLARIDDGRALERHAEAALARFTPDPEQLAALRNAQGLLRLAAGEPEAAIDHFADAVELVAVSPEGELRQQAPLNNYANALAAAGRYAEARAALERAVALAERNLGPDHPSLIGYFSNLGFIADRQGRGDNARMFLERAVVLGESALGTEHPVVYEATNNLAVHHYSAGELDVAEALFERTLVAARKNLGPDHPNLGKVIANLALCASEQGDSERALVRYDEALAIEERGLGPDHIDVAQTLNNRGSALRRLGRHDEAAAAYARALGIRKAKLGEQHPDTGTTINNLGLLAMAQGRAAEAVEHHGRALAIWQAAHGEQHDRVASALTDLAAAHVALGESGQRVRTLLERADAIWRGLERPDPAMAAQTRLALAEEIAADDPTRARALARAALDAFTSRSPLWKDAAARTRALLERIGG